MPEREVPTDEPDGWERHRREQLLAIARGTTPEQRLAWLEEAIAFAHRAGALPKRDDDAAR